MGTKKVRNAPNASVNIFSMDGARAPTGTSAKSSDMLRGEDPNESQVVLIAPSKRPKATARGAESMDDLLQAELRSFEIDEDGATDGARVLKDVKGQVSKYHGIPIIKTIEPAPIVPSNEFNMLGTQLENNTELREKNDADIPGMMLSYERKAFLNIIKKV